MAESADVLVESFRPGVLDKLGVGYDVLSKANPALVYCPITGYGQDGPNRDRAGHDMNYLGLNGILGLTGEAGGPPIQSGAQIADLGGGGLMAAVGILAALQEARRSGQGQMVDISMTDGSLSWLAMEAGRYFGSGRSRSAATSCSRAGSSVTGPTRPRTAGSPAAPSSRSSGRASARRSGART